MRLNLGTAPRAEGTILRTPRNSFIMDSPLVPRRETAREREDRMHEPTVAGFFEALEPKLNENPSRLGDMNCVYRFDIGEESYSVCIKEGQATVEKGGTTVAHCTVMMAREDFLDLIAGRINGQVAFLTGKLKVAGDMNLALKLGELIKR
jgi:putative sterol carrier protein